MISQLTAMAISLNPVISKPSIFLPRKPNPLLPPILSSSFSNPSSASTAQIDLSFNPTTGVFTPHQPLVVVLWDLDNKPPRGPPYPAALSLRRLAELFGRVDSISAYANRHAFSHLPQWVLHQRRQQRQRDILERKGLSIPSNPYICSVCGRKFNTNINLKNHFKNLHERERKKKLARMNSLKGKKRQKYKERFISGNVKYEEAARQILTPKNGYGLATELRRAGVYVKTVEDKPQAADAAVKRQMIHSMARGIDWLVLVSDDSDFGEMIRKARENNLRIVVVGDGRNALGKHADLWIPWVKVENGDVGEDDLNLGRWNVGWDEENEEGGGVFLKANFYEGGNVDDELEEVDDELEGMVDEIVSRRSLGFCGDESSKLSAFSEEDAVFDMFGSTLNSGGFDTDSEGEDDYYI